MPIAHGKPCVTAPPFDHASSHQGHPKIVRVPLLANGDIFWRIAVGPPHSRQISIVGQLITKRRFDQHILL